MVNTPFEYTVPSGPSIPVSHQLIKSVIKIVHGMTGVYHENIYEKCKIFACCIQKRKYENRNLRASMLDKDEDKGCSLSKSWGMETPGGGSVVRSLSSFCILRFSLAAWAIYSCTGGSISESSPKSSFKYSEKGKILLRNQISQPNFKLHIRGYILLLLY